MHIVPGPLKNSIRKYRLKRGMTQAALADRLEVTTATISLMERSKQAITDTQLKRLAAILKVSETTLLKADREGQVA